MTQAAAITIVFDSLILIAIFILWWTIRENRNVNNRNHREVILHYRASVDMWKLGTPPKQKCNGCAGGCEECRPRKSTAKNTLRPFTLTCKCGHFGIPSVEENGPHHTATCTNCGKFIKHLSAGELRVWKNYSVQSV